MSWPSFVAPLRPSAEPRPRRPPTPVAIVIPSFEPGGTERQMIELVRRLDRSRWEVHLCCLHARGQWYRHAAETASSVQEFPITSFRHPHVLGEMRRFADWCRRTRIVVVHAAELYSNIFALPAAAAARVPVRIGSRREIVAGKSRAQLLLQRGAYSCAHLVVANAEAVAARLRHEFVPKGKVFVVPNGLDLATFRGLRSPSAQRIMMVANLRPEKGHDTLIDAAVMVTARFPDVRFELVGDGTERPRLEAQARRLGLSGAVMFRGHCEDVPARLATSEIFALPSRSEAFPNAVLEAMAAGVPVVASAVGGIPEVVRDNHTGLLVPPGRPDILAEKLCRLLADRALRDRLSSAGRAFVSSRYSFDRMVTSIERIYIDAIGRHAAHNVARAVGTGD